MFGQPSMVVIPEIPATAEAEIGMIAFQGQPEQKVQEASSQPVKSWV
jgi:hypothetical protein